jgi:16S rRNA (cytidine1402-2'-O)-methyltransferase
MLVLNDFNESKTFEFILNQLKDGKNLALVSDAGTPLISDPGYKLVRECIKNGIDVDSIPGATAAITALTLSGLAPDRFMFVGYPPEKPGHRNKWFSELKSVNTTIIVYLSPYKMKKNLEEMLTIFGDIEITLAHELTKIHQEVKSQKISEWLKKLKTPKGEYVLLFRP